jgi:hypothetical protein
MSLELIQCTKFQFTHYDCSNMDMDNFEDKMHAWRVG